MTSYTYTLRGRDMKLSDGELKRFISKLYKFLREPHIISFKKLREYRGWVEWKSGNPHVSIITLDHRDSILSTLIHEFIHHLEPEWDEDRVLKMEKAVLECLSERQVRNIIKRLAERL